MRGHRPRHLERGRFQQRAQRRTVDELGHLVADDVHAEHAVGRCVGDHLGEAAGLAPHHRAGVAAEGEHADADVVTRLARLGLAEAERGDLRRAVGGARHQSRIERVRVATGDRLDGDDALVHRLVRKLEAAGTVADRADPGGAGALLAVDGDRAALDGHAGLLETDVLDVAGAAHRHQQDGRLEALFTVIAAHGHRHPTLIALHGGRVEGHPHQAADPTRLELLAQLAPDRLVLERHQPRRHLDDGDIAAGAAPEGGELHPHRAGAEHDGARRHAVEKEGVVAGEQLLTVGGDVGQLPRA